MTKNEAPAAPAYTDTEATEAAVMLLLRKLRRSAPEALAAVLAKLPEGAAEALAHAEQRGDAVADADAAAGYGRLGRPFPSRFEIVD